METDGQMDGRMNGRTDERTEPHTHTSFYKFRSLFTPLSEDQKTILTRGGRSEESGGEYRQGGGMFSFFRQITRY